MNISQDKRKSTGHRLAIVEGHLKKVRSMVEQGANCIDIIHQSRAIQQALKKFDQQIVHQHVRVCVARDMRASGGVHSEKSITELLDVFDRL